MTLLHPGDPFPTISLHQPGGRPCRCPDVLAGGFGVVLFNRGSWCPYCTAQLRPSNAPPTASPRSEQASSRCGSTTKPPPRRSSPSTV